ncbi:MAG: hypothetical protein ACTSQ0_06595 [Candidatus Heimdallarchaeota archaeon]
MTFLNAATNNDNDFEINAKKKEPIDSTNVTELTYWDDNYGTIFEVVVEGNYAYLSLGLNGFLIVDVSDLTAPRVVAEWDTYTCRYMYIEADIIYATNNTAIYILDASDFSNMNVISNWTVSTTINDILVDGNFVHLTTTANYEIYNITDLATPTQTDSYAQAGLSVLQLDGDILYVEDSNRVRILNVSDVTSIDYLSDVYYSGLDNFIYSNDTLYMTDSDDVYLYNVTIQGSPAYLFDYALNYTSGVANLWVTGNYILINTQLAIEIFDISNTSAPLYYSYYEDTFTSANFQIVGENIYLWDGTSLEILDSSDLMDIYLVWLDQFDGYAYDVFLDGNFAYVADGSNLQIMDITDFNNPVEVGQFFDENNFFTHVYVNNGFAYLLESGFGLRIVDVTDPANPVERGNITLAHGSEDIYANDEYVFVSHGGPGLSIVDVYYPDYPQLSLLYQEVGDVYDAEMIGNTLYLACGSHLQIIDLSNPYEPEPIANYTRTTSFYYSLAVSEEYIYAVSLGEGFDIIDIVTDITTPAKVGQYFTYLNPVYISVEGDFIYILDGTFGFSLFDAFSIAHPKLIATFDAFAGVTESFTVRNGYIFATTGLNGTHILTTSPLLTAQTPFLGPLAFFAGLTIFSVIVIFIRKKKRN